MTQASNQALGELLIELYGIETAQPAGVHGIGRGLLIELYGIETPHLTQITFHPYLLIELYGIETREGQAVFLCP